MGDKPSLLRLDDQPPVIRLFVSFLFTVATGTMIFWLFIWCGSLIFGTGVEEMLAVPDPGAGQRAVNILRYAEVAQQIGLFLIPSLLLALLLRTGDASYLKLNKPPLISDVVLIAALVLIIIPVITWTGIINSKIHLPEWLSGLQAQMSAREDKASVITDLLIGADSIGGMSVNILILALLPAVAEELIFRGIFQQLFIAFFRSHHTGIWVTSVLFSAIHFQFFGFLPRLILGLLFGYLFFWSGNLWTAIIPHFVNNSVPVVITLISAAHPVTERNEVKENVFPFLNIIFSALMIYYLWNAYRRRKGDERRL